MRENPRTELKACVQQRNELAAKADDLRALKYAAELTIQEAETLVAKYADLDAKISAYRVQALKRKQDPRQLPSELKTELDERRSAIEELEWSRSTLEQVSADLATAERGLALLDDKRGRLAVDLLKELGTQVCDELNSLNRRRLQLVQLLEGLADTNAVIGGRTQFIGRFPKLIEAIEGAPVAPWPGGITPSQANAKRWAERLQAILGDPDAKIAVPRPVQPSELVIGNVPRAVAGMGLAIPFELRPEE